MELKGLQDDDFQNSSNTGKNKLNGNKNIKVILALVLLVIAAIGIFGFKLYTANKEKEEQEQAEIQQEDELQQRLRDPHLSMDYYINEVRDTTYTNKAVATAIAHVITTGCSTTYDYLRNYFDIESMEYLYDFVTGNSCAQYEVPALVLQEEGSDYQNYKIRYNATRQFIIHINLDKEGYPKTFTIMNYETRNNILGEFDSEENNGEGKDHSDISEATTVTETTTSTETTTEVTTTTEITTEITT